MPLFNKEKNNQCYFSLNEERNTILEQVRGRRGDGGTRGMADMRAGFWESTWDGVTFPLPPTPPSYKDPGSTGPDFLSHTQPQCIHYGPPQEGPHQEAALPKPGSPTIAWVSPGAGRWGRGGEGKHRGPYQETHWPGQVAAVRSGPPFTQETRGPRTGQLLR